MLIKFLKENPLVINVENSQLQDVRTILKELNDIFVLEWDEIKSTTKGGYEFRIICPSTSFANAYYHIGCKLMRKMKIKQKEDIMKSKIPIKYSNKQ